MRAVFLVFLLMFVTVFKIEAQPYNYTLEGFDNAIFPAATPGPAVETQYVSATGAWAIFKGYTVTGTDPCPNDGTNRALRFLANNAGYVITPTLNQGVATLTFNTGRTNRNITYYTSTDNGVTWSAANVVNSGATACNTISVTFNSGVINKIKIANLLANDVGIDNVLITSYTTVPPILTTTAASGITFTTAVSGGNITSDGGAPVTVRGVCWSTTPNPTIANSLTSNGTGLGIFTSNLAGLSPGTTYHVRAYATNLAGTGYGNDVTFTTPVATPTLTATPSPLAFGIVYQGAYSTEQSFTVSGVYLSPATGTVTITPPPGYIISLTSGSGYTSSLSLPYSGSTLAPTIIYIRFAPPVYGNYDGNISISGGGAPAVSVAVTGIGSQLPQSGTLTNMGVDFWTGYGYHSRMSNNDNTNGAWMSLYISAKQAATVRVSLPGIADPTFPRIITIPANTSVEVTNFPQGDFNNNNDNPTNLPDARLYFTGITPRGIHIESLNGVPVAVYEHTYGKDAAGAMLIFPTNTWGATYNVVSLGGKSNSGVPNSFFFVMAAQDQTQVEITPTADIIDSSSATLFNSNTPAANILHPAGVPFTITLNKGQVFNAMAKIVGSGSSGVSQDFTGTLVRSTDCANKKIAVWAGNGRTFVNTNGCTQTSGSDNMVQQMFPRVAWGTKYLTTPTKTMEYGIYKICVLDPTTQVWFNNPTHTTPLTGLVNNFYYQVESNSPNLIESDKPIMVIQYIITGNCKNNTFGNNGGGDPEMIILSPVQQAINNISVFSASKMNISSGASYINVVIKNAGVPSFKLDPITNPTNVCDTGASSYTGTAYASSTTIPVANAFRPHPYEPGYSYAKFKVGSGVYHNLVSDSGFNAIAYGMATGESYGYNAGTAIRDLSAIVQSLNPYDTIPGSKTCKGNPVRLQIAVPYLASTIDSIKWDMGNNANITPNGSIMQINPVPDRTYVDNEITYSVYTMTIPVVFNATGVYRVIATIYGTFSSECGNSQQIPIDMEVVSDTARFNFTTTGCTSTVVHFTDSSAAYNGGSLISWQWNFGDNTTFSGQNPPNHTFPAIGIYNVNIRTINNIGCFADTTRVVDLTGGLLANFGVAPDSIICTGNTITFSDSSTNTGPYGPITVWHWNYGIGSTVNVSTNANQTYTYNTPGTYTATLQVETGNGCLSNIDSIHISVNAAPVITLTSAATTPTQNICVNSPSINITYALSGGATGATLSGNLPPGMTGSFNAGVFTISGTPTSTGTFNYTVTTVSTCTNVSLSGTLTVIAVPTMTLTSAAATTNQTLCVNNPIAGITYSVGGSGTGATVSGLPAGVTGVFNAGIFTISGTPTVSGIFNYTVTTVSPCNQVNLSGTMTINAQPTLTLTSAASTAAQIVCANTAIVTVTYALGGSASGATITGSLPAGVTGTYNSGVYTISGTPTATGIFTYTINSVSPCSNVSLSGSIEVDAAPTLTLSSAASTTTQTICIGAPITAITYTIGGSGSGATVTGLPAGVSGNFSAGVFTISGTPTASGVFNYTVTTLSPCPNLSLSGTLTVLSLPSITLTSAASTASQSVCINSPATAITYSLGGSATGATLSGSLPPGVTGSFNGGVYTISGTPTVSGIYNYTVTSVSVCSNVSLSGTITVNALPVAAFTFSNIRCSGDVVTFTDASTPNAAGISQWSWVFGDGNSQTVNTTGPVTHTYASANTYTVQLTVTNTNGCVSLPVPLQVLINPKPVAAFNFSSICIPFGNAVFADNSTITSGTINQWSWNFGDNTPAVSTQNPTHVYTTGGNYNVTLTATSAAGCVKDTTRTVTVYNAPTASYTINNSGNICSNSPLSISNASVVNGFGTVNLVEIYWDFANNPTIMTSDNTPVSGETYTHDYPVFGTPATKVYKVLIKAYSGNGCVNEYFQDITLYAAPDVQFGTLSPVCQEVPVITLATASDLFGNTGTGTYSGDGITSSPVFIPSAAGPGDHTIQYLFVASNGCRDSATQVIRVNPTPQLDLGPDRNILEGDQVTLAPLTANGNGLSYLWSPGTYLSSTAIANPLCTPANDITYTVQVRTAEGCEAIDDIFIKVVRDFIVPNTFTPNGDGINDLWKIENLFLYPDHHVIVFDRYGQKLFDTKNYTEPWNGTIKGKPLPSGTYYYIIDLGGTRPAKKGYVTIVR